MGDGIWSVQIDQRVAIKANHSVVKKGDFQIFFWGVFYFKKILREFFGFSEKVLKERTNRGEKNSKKK